MKKNLYNIIIVSLTIVFTATLASAQSRLFSKKEDLKDMNEKTLMVVLENNSLIDASLKEAVTKIWDLGRYSFCSTEEFEKIKTDTSYYFIIRVQGMFKKESDPGIEFISLLKGGKDAVTGIDNMYEVLSLPFQPLDDGNNYILPFIDSYIRIFKSHVQRIQEHKIAATIGIGWYSNRLSKIGKKTIIFNGNDLSGQDLKDEIEDIFKGNAIVADEDEIELAMAEQKPNTLVSICIAPEEPQNGSYCYKMLVGADNSELYYFQKQKISAKNPKGFQLVEIKKIAIPFMF